jgi:hypothetical protein
MLQVREVVARIAQPRTHLRQDFPAVDARQRRIGRGKVAPQVAGAQGAQQCVGHGVEQHIAVRVALETPLEGHRHATQYQRASGHQLVGVEAVSNPHASAHASAFRQAAMRCSAAARSTE